MVLSQSDSWLHSRPVPISISVRQREIENRSFSGLPFAPGLPSVPMHNPLHRCQADAMAFILMGRMQTLERSEQLVGVLHVEAHSVVPHEKRRFAPRRSAAKFNSRRVMLARKLPRISEQIFH